MGALAGDVRARLQAEAFEGGRFAPDPVDLALATGSDVDEATLRGHLSDRRRLDQTLADDLVLARLRLRAELEWHGLVLDQLGELGATP